MTAYERTNTIIAVIAIVLSLGALAVSIVTVYLTFFRKSAKLAGILLHGQFQEVVGSYDTALEYGLCNTGNVQLLLKEVGIVIPMLSIDKKSTGFAHLDVGCVDIPSVIEPKTLKVVLVRFKTKDIQTVRENNERCLTSFTLVSAHGKLYEAKHDFTQLGWEPVKGIPGEPTPYTIPPREIWMPFNMRGVKV